MYLINHTTSLIATYILYISLVAIVPLKLTRSNLGFLTRKYVDMFPV